MTMLQRQTDNQGEISMPYGQTDKRLYDNFVILQPNLSKIEMSRNQKESVECPYYPTAYKAVKRLLDIIVSFTGVFCVLMPLTVIVKLLYLKNGDKQSIFFVQERIGKGGKPFKIFKFRTMVPDAERLLEELMEKYPEIKKEYLTNKKLKDDPRITKMGRVLRKLSFDEFPQLLNVLKNEMSLIGPRPYLPCEKDDIGKYLKYIVAFKPGITGMWQAYGHSGTDFKRRLKFDRYYYRKNSIKLDMHIFFVTIFEKIFNKGEAI